MEAGAYRQFAEQEESHWWFRGRKAIFSHVCGRILGAAHADSGRPPRILDLGCGMGGMLGALGSSGPVHGLDMDQGALVHCRDRGFPRVVRGTGRALPFPDACFDMVTAFDTIEHIAEDEETLAEVRRILRPGGHVVISVPAYQWLYTNQDRLVHHHRRYTAGQLERKLRAAGLAVRKTSYINFLLFPLILPVVLLMKLKQAAFKPPEDSYFTNASFPVPSLVSGLLYRIFSFERHVLSVTSVPLGHSLLAIGVRPSQVGGARHEN